MPKAQEEVEKLRVPGAGEIFGVVDQIVGFDRLRVRCRDGHVRICRIPGKMKKRDWVRIDDVVIVSPWKVQGDKKADIVHRYSRTEVEWLRRKGILE